MKKIVSIITVMALLLTAMAGSTVMSFAAQDSGRLKEAITKVKSVITIPGEYSEFEYYSEESENGTGIINMTWTDPEKGYISASVADGGIITSYYRGSDEWMQGVAKLTKEQGRQNADKYIKKLAPETKGEFKCVKSYTDSYSSSYSYDYTLYVEDIPVDFVSAMIDVNKMTGELTGYHLYGSISDLKAEYPKGEKVLTQEEAEKLYIEKIGPELQYSSYYNYNKEALKVFAVYILEGTGTSINAVTGEKVEPYLADPVFREYMNAAAGGVAYDEEKGAGYSQAELNEITQTEKLISKTEADSKVKALAAGIKGQKLEGASLMKDSYVDENYLWLLNYENGYATVNAANGQVLSFNIWDDGSNYSDSRNIGYDKALKAAEDFVGKACPGIKNEMTLTDNRSEYEVMPNTWDYDYSFNYERMHEGTAYPENGVTVGVDKATGKINCYYLCWYDNVKFPGLDGIIDRSGAFNAVKNEAGFGLKYVKDSENKITLVYDVTDREYYQIDAVSGKPVDYRGNAIEYQKDYTDISGNWAEKIIKDLKDNGYYLPGEKFRPKEAITQADFFYYLYTDERSIYSDTDEFYDRLVSDGIIKSGEAAPDAQLTRQDAAKFICRYLGIGKITEKSQIFKNVFADKVDSGYEGYAAALYALNIVKGNSKGAFNGSAVLTRAEAATLIYNTLKAR